MTNDLKVTALTADATKYAEGVVVHAIDGSGTAVPVSTTDAALTYRADSYVNITTKTTTAVKAAAGTLAKLIVNKVGSTDTVAIYDSLAGSGTLVGTFTSPPVGSYAIDVAMGTGITVVTGGSTAGDYTIVYR